MIRFNPKKVLANAAARKLKKKPLPKVKVPRALKEPISSPGLTADYQIIDEAANFSSPIHSIEREYYQVRLERNKLSTEISYLVESGASQEELAEHYQKIQNLRPIIQAHYGKIQHFKKFGDLPEVETIATDITSMPLPDFSKLSAEERHLNILELTAKKRKLVDKRSKLKAKLRQSAKPAKPDKILEWQQELEMANVEYDVVERQIKELEGKA